MLSGGQAFERLNFCLKHISGAETSVLTFDSYFAVIHSQNDFIDGSDFIGNETILK